MNKEIKKKLLLKRGKMKTFAGNYKNNFLIKYSNAKSFFFQFFFFQFFVVRRKSRSETRMKIKEQSYPQKFALLREADPIISQFSNRLKNMYTYISRHRDGKQ